MSFRFLVALLILFAAPLAAQQPIRPPSATPAPVVTPPPPGGPGSELTIYLMTMGVGEDVWEQFGHNAIWIHDDSRGTDAVYNWGLFDFNQPNFIPRFLKGVMLYSMGAFTLDQTLAEYRGRNRTIWSQELELSPVQRRELRDFVEWNALPENRDYPYDYFTDNCSTRVRDVLDRVLDGAISKRARTTMTPTTYRWHAVRLTSVDLPMATGIDVGLGRPADRPLSVWETMFLPMELRDYVRNMVVTDSLGGEHPLVRSEQVLYQSQAHAEPLAPPPLGPWFLAIGLVVAALIVALCGVAAHGAMWPRVPAGVLICLWSLLAGFLGLLLALLWAFTHHRFAYANENLFVFNPLWLVLAVLAPMAISQGRALWAARITAYILAASAAIGLLIHVVGLSAQTNLPILGIAVPITFACAWGVHAVAQRIRITG